MIKQIIPTRIEEKTSKNGKPYLLITDENDKYLSVWEKDLFAFFELNNPIEVEIRVDGDFRNIVAIDTLATKDSAEEETINRITAGVGEWGEQKPISKDEDILKELKNLNTKVDSVLRGLALLVDKKSE